MYRYNSIVMILVCLSIVEQSQAQLYSTDFSSSSGTFASCTNNSFAISGGLLSASNPQNCDWTSDSFSFEGYSEITITSNITFDGDGESNDYLQVGYSVDGGSVTFISDAAQMSSGDADELEPNGVDMADNGSITFSYDLSGLSGTNIQIVFRFQTSVNSETWEVDDLTVTGKTFSNQLYCNDFSSSSGTFSSCFSNYFQISGGQLEASNPSTCVWTSTSFSLSSYSEIIINADINFVGDGEAADYLQIGYSVDGGGVTYISDAAQMAASDADEIEPDGNDMADNGSMAFSYDLSGLSGTNLQLVLRFQTSANSEIWEVDNLCVGGKTLAATPEICNNGIDDDGDGVIDFVDSDCFNIDTDGDGTDDATDTDGDSIPDVIEGRCVPEALSGSDVTNIGNANSIVSSSNVSNGTNLLDGNTGTNAAFTASGTAVIDLGAVIYTYFSTGAIYTISTDPSNNFQIYVEESTDGVNWSDAGYVPDILNGAGNEDWPFIPLINTRYIRISEYGSDAAMQITRVTINQTIPACTDANSDGTGNANYNDLDSDDDGCVDSLEIGRGYSNLGPRDFNNDGVPDYQDAAYNNCTPDTDGDGVSDLDDLDDDNDGIMDEVEDGCVEAVVFPGSSVAANSISMITPQYILEQDDLYTYTDNVGDNIVVDFGRALDIGTTYTVYWRTRSNGNNAVLSLSESTDNVTFNDNDFDTGTAGTQFDETDVYPAQRTTTITVQTDGTRYVRIERRSGSFEIDLDAVLGSDASSGEVVCNPTDTDGDGVIDASDPDSDNDGILDRIEAQTDGTKAGSTDLSGTDTDGDGLDDNFDSGTGTVIDSPVNTDGDALADFRDADTDGDQVTIDGIVYGYDYMEGFDDDGDYDAQAELIALGAAVDPTTYNSTDSNANGVPDWLDDDDADGVPNFSDPNSAHYADSDSDGLADLFDSDAGGSDSNTPGGSPPYYRDPTVVIILPVQLISFTGMPDEESVMLNWITASEINSAWFDIEHSVDGQEFMSIGRLSAAGQSHELMRYSFKHGEPQKGLNYYRLKQVDIDGSYEYSKALSIDMENSDNTPNTVVFPNPSENLFIVSSKSETIRSIVVYDVLGRVVYRTEVENSVGVIDLSAIVNGRYTAVIQTASAVIVKYLLKK